MIRFTCPCGKSLSAREEYAGETTRCPSCEHELTIPGTAGVQAKPASREPDEEGIRQTRRGRGDALDEGSTATKTSGMAIASIIFGLVALFPCSVLTGLPAIIFGGLSLGAIGRSRGRLKGKGLAITGIVTGGVSFLLLPLLLAVGLLLPAVVKVKEAATRLNNMNNLKQITLAIQTYNNTRGTFPPAAVCDPTGKPLLSWRVAVLPYLGESVLYNQFKLDEPWDGPNNSKLISQMPKVYALPSDATAQPGYTYYRVFVGNGAAFDWCKGAKMPNDFGDGFARTILIAEAATAVPWTKPDELDFNPNGALPALGGHFSGGATVGLVDGSVRQIPQTISPQTLKAAITRSGGDTLGPDW